MVELQHGQGSFIINSQFSGSTLTPNYQISKIQLQEKVKCLQDQMRQLKKLMWHKENEFSKDKAIWVQRNELLTTELEETRERLESQKKYYLQMITQLKLTNSPMKENICMETKLNDSINKPFENALNESIQSISSPRYKNKIEEILIKEEAKSEIEQRAKVLAKQLNAKQVADEVKAMQEKLNEYEK